MVNLSLSTCIHQVSLKPTSELRGWACLQQLQARGHLMRPGIWAKQQLTAISDRTAS